MRSIAATVIKFIRRRTCPSRAATRTAAAANDPNVAVLGDPPPGRIKIIADDCQFPRLLGPPVTATAVAIRRLAPVARSTGPTRRPARR
jgi:hypothetical protein